MQSGPSEEPKHRYFRFTPFIIRNRIGAEAIFMTYLIYRDRKPAGFAANWDAAKANAESLAVDGSVVGIEIYAEPPTIPLAHQRFDRKLNAWVSTDWTADEFPGPNFDSEFECYFNEFAVR
jgi:hypothetical protein